METRHFIEILCKQKVKTFFLSTLIALNVRWVPRFINHVKPERKMYLKYRKLCKFYIRKYNKFYPRK